MEPTIKTRSEAEATRILIGFDRGPVPRIEIAPPGPAPGAGQPHSEEDRLDAWARHHGLRRWGALDYDSFLEHIQRCNEISMLVGNAATHAPLTPEEYRERAFDLHHVDGEVEVDDPFIVSIPVHDPDDERTHGAYVSAAVWVPDPEPDDETESGQEEE